jgi:hypothetical protein
MVQVHGAISVLTLKSPDRRSAVLNLPIVTGKTDTSRVLLCKLMMRIVKYTGTVKVEQAMQVYDRISISLRSASHKRFSREPGACALSFILFRTAKWCGS